MRLTFISVESNLYKQLTLKVSKVELVMENEKCPGKILNDL